MKIYVLYDKSGIHSGRVLGQHLIRRLTGKASVSRGRPKHLEKLHRKGARFDYIVNVGWYKGFDPKGAVVLNVPESIRTSSNKRNARIRFKSKAISAPKLWLKKENIQQVDLPVIARKTHHSKGRGLWFCKTIGDLCKAADGGATHFLKYIPNVREFRVHVMAPKAELGKVTEEDYRVIKVSEKLPRGKAKRTDIVKNHGNGWYFGYPDNKKDPALKKVRDVARKAIKAFGLHWGAVDVMISRDTGSPYVLEINSTPCLTDDQANTLEKYSNAICVLLGLEPLPLKKRAPAKIPAKPPKIKKIKKEMKRDEQLKKLLKRI